MIRRTDTFTMLAWLCLAGAARAQEPLTLSDAVQRARSRSSEARVAAAYEREAAQRVTQAKAGYWPRVDLTEAWQRSNHPVFVFSSLLSQKQFTAANFAIASLNDPAAVDNFKTSLTIEQPIFDRSTTAQVTAAAIERESAATRRLVVAQDLGARITAAYAAVTVAAAARRSAEAAWARARADREVAGHRRDAGLVTDADVLQLDLHVSRTLERQIIAASDEQVTRARLNQGIGEPLDAVFTLESPATPPTLDASDLGALEAEALENRPDLKIAALHERMAGNTASAARAAFLPQIGAQAGWEINGGSWGAREPSWAVGAVARINLFQGFAGKARLAEAREQITRRAVESEEAATAARLDVRIAVARLEAARAREAVGRAAVTQANESRRIIRDRYEAGLTDVTSLLRASEGVVEAETQEATARAAVLTETAALARALGRQSPS